MQQPKIKLKKEEQVEPITLAECVSKITVSPDTPVTLLASWASTYLDIHAKVIQKS